MKSVSLEKRWRQRSREDDRLTGRDSVESGNYAQLEQYIDRDPAFLSTSSRSGKTLLHYAVMKGQEKIVELIAKKMSLSTLKMQESKNNYTALALAAITSGNTKIAKYIVKGRPEELLSIEDRNRFIPVVLASAKGHKQMTRYLYRKTPISDYGRYSGYNGVYLLCNCIRSEILDIAWKLLKDYPDLPTDLEVDGSPRPLAALARVPSAFPSGRTVKFWHCFLPKKKVLGPFRNQAESRCRSLS